MKKAALAAFFIFIQAPGFADSCLNDYAIVMYGLVAAGIY